MRLVFAGIGVGFLLQISYAPAALVSVSLI
jgi:hypothetical protein